MNSIVYIPANATAYVTDTNNRYNCVVTLIIIGRFTIVLPPDVKLSYCQPLSKRHVKSVCRTRWTGEQYPIFPLLHPYPFRNTLQLVLRVHMYVVVEHILLELREKIT